MWFIKNNKRCLYNIFISSSFVQKQPPDRQQPSALEQLIKKVWVLLHFSMSSLIMPTYRLCFVCSVFSQYHSFWLHIPNHFFTMCSWTLEEKRTKNFFPCPRSSLTNNTMEDLSIKVQRCSSVCVCVCSGIALTFFAFVQRAWRTGTCLAGCFLLTHWVEERRP